MSNELQENEGAMNPSQLNDATQQDFSHDTQSSPNVLADQQDREQDRQLSAKANTWNGDATQIVYNKSSPPAVQVEDPNDNDDDEEEDTVPKMELTIESQVEMNQERNRVALYQGENRSRQIGADYKRKEVKDDADDDVISNSQESCPTQPVGDFKNGSSSQPTQIVQAAATSSSRDGTQPVGHDPRDWEYATQPIDTPNRDGTQPVDTPNRGTQPVESANLGVNHLADTPNDATQPTKFFQHTTNLEYQSSSPTTQAVMPPAVEDEENTQPQTQIIGTNSDYEPTQVVNNRSVDATQAQDTQPVGGFDSKDIPVGPVVQVSSTPLSQSDFRRRTIIQKDSTPGSLEAIVSSDESDSENPGGSKDSSRPTKVPASMIAKKRKFDMMTPARQLQYGNSMEVQGSTPGAVLFNATGERAAKRSKLAQETPITRHNSSPYITNENNANSYSSTDRDLFELGSCVWVRWTGDKYYPVKTVDKTSRTSHNSVVKRLKFALKDLHKINDRVDIVFGDGREGEASISNFHPLDLQVGDEVKYEDQKKLVFTVTDVKYDESCGDTVSTRSGDNCAILTTKKDETEVLAPIWKLYMVRKQWTNYLKKREKLTNAFASPSLGSPRREAAVNYEEEPTSSAPLATALSAAGEQDNTNQSNNNDIITNNTESYGIMSNALVSGTGIFQSCVFAVTMESNPQPRYDEKLIKSIEINGGMVLRDGFRGMFEDSAADTSHEKSLVLKPQYCKIKFAAVIANTFRRTHKYMEALALGWPCLSYQYIEDCLSTGQFVPEWSSYMLAAGQSDILNAIVSNDISQFKIAHREFWPLEEIVKQRLLIFGDWKSTLYLIEPSGKPGTKEDSSRAEFRFLLRVMGCNDLKVVSSNDQLPKGSVAVENFSSTPRGKLPHSRAAGSSTSGASGIMRTPVGLLDKIISGTNLEEQSIIYSRQWIIQAIINRRVV